ncbi:GntR family transcriptional regulator [Frigidibacter sp. MR17.14]|uniref:GntR family transcriptional regulator n=1 Tax=Frigidibacter sp. MR17.14 TaxID=3126509 RepID=UPI003012EC42
MSERDGEKVAALLREAILRLDLRPGVILDEAEVGARLGVSRTPVREAIIQLIADGLVVREGRKAKVAPLDFDDVPKLYDALLISSRLVHRQAALRRTTADLKAIRAAGAAFEAACASGDGVKRSEDNFAFHAAIAAAADNHYLARFYIEALIGTMRLARACFATTDEETARAMKTDLDSHLSETMRQHQEIIEAIERRDATRSDELAVIHYELTKNRVIEVLFSHGQEFTAIKDLSLDTWDIPKDFMLKTADP